MSNLIRRDKAIDYFVTNIGIVDADGYAVDDYDERIKIWTERFSGIPSAEPERKWIPVTEALPEEETNVLVTVHYDGDKYYRYKPNDYVTTAEYMCDRWCFADEEFIMQLHKHHVIAWAPLPKPWEG